MSEYKDALKRESRNLTELARKSRLAEPAFREEIIEKIVDCVHSKRSFLLCGDQGVGKSAVLQGLALRLGKENRQLRELSTGVVLTNTKYLGEWQTKAKSIVDSARKSNAVLCFTDIWNLPSVGASTNDPSSLLDFLREDIRNGNIIITGELTLEAYEDLHKVPGFISLFDLINVPPLSQEQLAEIVSRFSETLALGIGKIQIQHIFRLCGNFKAKQPGPGPALELVRQIKNYQTQKQNTGEEEPVTNEFIDKVFCVYSGLPLFVVSPDETRPVSAIRSWFRDHIIGQEKAIEAVTETITLFKAGIRDPHQPVGTFLFVGPTGVGKTELAKALATYLFGSTQRLLRFDMSEYKDYHSFQLLIGDPENPRQPARLVDPVRGQPFQVILFDEIEKAHPNIWDLLLQLLDEGRLSPTSGKTVDFRNTIIICTSNAGAENLRKESIGFTAESISQISVKALEQSFRPEILNRFQHIVSFHPLNRDHMAKIARSEIKKILQREGIASRNLAVDLSEEVISAVIDSGFDSRYGARALKRAVQRCVALPVASFLMENQVTAGSLLMLRHQHGRTVVKSVKTAESRQQTSVEKAKLISDKNRLQQNDQYQLLCKLSDDFRRFNSDTGKEELELRLQILDEEKESPDFWQDNQLALSIVLETEKITRKLQRLDSFENRLEDVHNAFSRQLSREQLRHTCNEIEKLTRQLLQMRREMLLLGDHLDTDALLILTPVGSSPKARDHLFHFYKHWAKSVSREFTLISEPETSEDSVIIIVEGPYSFGYLRSEAGLHRLRHDDSSSTVRISTTSYPGDEKDVSFTSQRALKSTGVYGGKIRSLVQFGSTPPCSIKNGNILNDNRELARSVACATDYLIDSDEVIRRYDLSPYQVKDYITGFTTNRKEEIEGRGLQLLLQQRVDAIFGKND